MTFGRSTVRRLLVFCVLAALAAAPGAALLSVVETLRGLPIRRPADVLVSGDGRFVYVLGESALAVLERDPATGFIELVEAYLDGFDGVGGIFRSISMVLSPDDRFLYVGSPLYLRDDGVGRGAVAIFARDPAAGTLRLVDVETAGFDGESGLFDHVHLASSFDGAHLYAGSSPDHAVLVFARDAADGGLSFAGATTRHVDDEAYWLAAVIDPADRYLYLTQATVAGDVYHAGRVTVFARDAATGALAFVEDNANRVGGIEDMDVPIAATLSPDGAHLYVMNNVIFPYDGDLGNVVAFRRNQATGRLTFIGPQGDPNRYLPPPTRGAWNGDGTRLYVTAEAGNFIFQLSELVIYARNPASGSLEQIARIQEDQGLFGSASPVLAMTVSGDHKHLYTGAFNGRTLAVWELESDGGLRPVHDPSDPTGGRGALRGAADVAVSPDGRHVYVAGSGAGSRGVAAYARDPATARLTFVGFATKNSTSPVGNLAVSADGRWVYAVEGVFARDAESGRLRVVPQGFKLAGDDFVPSPDGRHLYVPREFPEGPIDAYAQAASGRLARVALRFPPVAGLGALTAAESAAVSADGAYLYAVGYFRGEPPSYDGRYALWAFARDPISGGLTLEAFANFDPPLGSLDLRLAVAPNGSHLYMVQPGADDLRVFRHDRGPKRLVQVERHVDGRDGVEGLGEPRDVAVSPSGHLVYAAGRRSNAVTVFSRDPEDGRLRFQEAVYGGPGVDDDLVRPESLAVAPGNRHVYVTSARLAAVTALTLDCLGGEGVLCLDDDRFRVDVRWRDGRGEGAGRLVPLRSRNSGLFWFFSADNWEMLVKVLDGCHVNDRFWVFAAATTDVGYTLRVTDVETGAVKEYVNPLGVASPAITDTGAFKTCP